MSPQGTVLLVDDDRNLCALIGEFLARAGYTLESVHDGATGLSRALDGNYELILLDVMLPGIDGFELLRQLRRRSSVPVIMLSARGGESDRISGLDSGADDYLPKPFGPEELLARIRAVLRRSRHTAATLPATLEYGPVRVNSGSGEAWAAGEPINVTSTEFEILELLVRAGGRAVPRDEVCIALYQRPATPYERSLEVHVSHLRKKLASAGVAIRSIRGIGYALSKGDTVA